MFHSSCGPMAVACVLGAGLAGGVAQAQSGVTIYGAFDVHVGRQSASGASGRGVLNSGFNPNVLGFTGQEDLGGGLQAGFVLENQPVLDTGASGQGGKIFGRQSLVYLGSADWGRLSLGRVHTAGRAFAIKYSATGWLTTDVVGNLNLAAGTAMSPVMNVDSVGSRVSNAVVYASPRLGGLSVSLMQSAAEGGSFATGSAKLTQIGAGYVQGPWSVDLVYNRIPAIAGSQVAQTDWAAGAQYNLNGTRLMAAYFSRKGSAVASAGATTALAGSRATDRILTAGVSVPLGSHSLGLSVGRLQAAAEHRGRRAANISAPFSAAVDDATAWSVSYAYALSKRTQWFAAYGTLDNGAQGTASLAADLRPVAGGRSSLLATGVRHSF